MKKSFYLPAVLFAFISILHTCFTKEAYQIEALKIHNKYRRIHHSPALRLDNELRFNLPTMSIIVPYVETICLLTLGIISLVFGSGNFILLSRQIFPQLNSLAVKCAVYYARRGDIDFTCPYQKDAGENLTGITGSNLKSTQVAVLSCNDWYSNAKFYNYDYARNNYGTLPKFMNFAQMVWKNTTKCGFGYARVDDYVVFVGLYSPKGMSVDGFPENVLEP